MKCRFFVVGYPWLWKPLSFPSSYFLFCLMCWCTPNLLRQIKSKLVWHWDLRRLLLLPSCRIAHKIKYRWSQMVFLVKTIWICVLCLYTITRELAIYSTVNPQLDLQIRCPKVLVPLFSFNYVKLLWRFQFLIIVSCLG